VIRGPEEGFRCSTLSRESGESQVGTASTVGSFLLVECPGPWGTDALRDSRLPEQVRRWLQRLERDTGVRPLLVRRPGRPVSGPTRVFAAYAGRGGPWLQRRQLEDPAELLHLDVAALARGRRPGWEEVGEPLFAVCTHGKHDACCAERGRPVVTALTALAPDATWEVSHIGGDRFAANVLVLPEGLYYGRLEPEDAAGLVRASAEGRLDLEHLRGRTVHPFPVQAAEVHLRRHLDEDRTDALQLLGHARTGSVTTARFAAHERRWTVRMATNPAAPCQLTCRAVAEGAPPAHELIGIVEDHPERAPRR
jgi:hypothetical protein